ncbi:MAG: hypothetical protein FWE37_01155 [Spirochaetaceae bacterium]|nr:hypothetical protein [Spirochaetaceae bacterium]
MNKNDIEESEAQIAVLEAGLPTLGDCCSDLIFYFKELKNVADIFLGVCHEFSTECEKVGYEFNRADYASQNDITEKIKKFSDKIEEYKEVEERHCNNFSEIINLLELRSPKHELNLN